MRGVYLNRKKEHDRGLLGNCGHVWCGGAEPSSLKPMSDDVPAEDLLRREIAAQTRSMDSESIDSEEIKNALNDGAEATIGAVDATNEQQLLNDAATSSQNGRASCSETTWQ